MDPNEDLARLPPETRRRLQEAARILAVGAIRAAAKEAKLSRKARVNQPIESNESADRRRSVLPAVGK